MLKVTEKLLEAEKKKLSQLELQLDEEIRCGTSSVEKVRLLFLDAVLSLYQSVVRRVSSHWFTTAYPLNNF